MEQQDQNGKPRYGLVNFERRRSPRFSVDLPIEYFRVYSTATLNGRAVNASEGGLMLYLRDEMEIGQRLKIRLYFPSELELDCIEVLCRVVWQEIAFGDPNEVRCGVEFIEISAEDLNRLKQFLDHLVDLKHPLRVSPRSG
jgi:c-di-GMP-binding flagellar brake protein YcgR